MAGSLMVFVARAEFVQAMRDPNNLVVIHRTLRRGPGKRTREVALNRAIVVLSVAAWQAYVQDVAKAALDGMRPPRAEPQGSFRVLRASLLNSVNRFATPNAENTRDLLLHVGFDPWPSWGWREGPGTLTSTQVCDRLNLWLRVRHAIAHGDRLPDVPMLSTTASGERSIRLSNARACISFFERLVDATHGGLDESLG